MGMNRKKVLWVDDEIEYLRSHIMFLETRGYSVTPVFNGDDAIHMLKDKPDHYDIVLLDEQMPGKDGLTTLLEIKELFPDLPVVMVTKSEEEQLMDDALGMKIDGYLTKPVNPSQILSVCKSLLDSKKIFSTQITQRYARSFSEIRSALQEELTFGDWVSIYEKLVKWDIELNSVDDEGIRQAHSGQKSDATALFSDFVLEYYYKWINNSSDAPIMSPKVVESFVLPKLKANEKVFFMVFDCMRLDQFMAIEPLLRKYFDVERHNYCTILPSSTAFTRNSLLSGLYPDELSREYPHLWDGDSKENVRIEEELLRKNLLNHGIDIGNKMTHKLLASMSDGQDLMASFDNFKEQQFVSIIVDFVELLIQSRSTSSIMQEIAPDENAFRRLTHSWFMYSNIYKMLKKLSEQDCTVILTTSNGSTFATRGTEVYGNPDQVNNLRYRFGENLRCDERYAFFMPDPKRFRLPAKSEDSRAIILKENYYFIQHDKFQNYNKQYQNTFQHGGVSLEEMVVPLAILKPRNLS